MFFRKKDFSVKRLGLTNIGMGQPSCTLAFVALILLMPAAGCDVKDGTDTGEASSSNRPSPDACSAALTEEDCTRLSSGEGDSGTCTWARALSSATDPCNDNAAQAHGLCVFAAPMEEHEVWVGLCDGDSYAPGEESPDGNGTLSLFYRRTGDGVELLEGYPDLSNTFPEDGDDAWTVCDTETPECSRWCCL